MILPRVYAGLALLVLLVGIGLGIRYYGHTQFEAGVASMQAKLDHQRVQDAIDQNEAMDLVAQRYEKARTDDIPKIAPTVVVALHAGTLQLRDEWAGPVPAINAPAGVADGQAELRAAGAGNLVQIGAAADAQIAGLQDALNVCLRRGKGHADPATAP